MVGNKSLQWESDYRISRSRRPIVNRHGSLVGVNDCEEVGSGGLDERFIADGMVRFAAKTAGASLLRCRNSMGRHFIHHGLPVSLSHFWIVCGEVGASQTEIEGRLPMRCVHGVRE